MDNNTHNMGQNSKRKRIWKFFWVSLSVIIIGLIFWVGETAYNSIKKITADSGSKNILFSIFKEPEKNILKGKKDGRTNILLLGMGGANHPGGGLSDTMIILSLDWKTNKSAFISLPRDLYVNTGIVCGSSKLNAVYYCGEQNIKKTGGGNVLLNQTLEKITGISINYNIMVDFEAFKKLIDKVGGVDVLVERDLSDPFYPAANMIDFDPFYIKAGEHHLDGKTALKYARSRETTSDFDRSRRQQQVLLNLKDKLFSASTLSNPIKITDILNILGSHLKTTMSLDEIKSFGEEIKNIDTKNMINRVFDTALDGPLMSTSDERGYIIYPKKGLNDYSEVQKIVQNIFTLVQPATLGSNSKLRLELLNGSGKVGVATNLSSVLKAKGFVAIRIGDATKVSETSTVYNCSGKSFEKEATEIASILKAPLMVKTSCVNIDVQVIVGKDNSLASKNSNEN